jgi:ACS family tartrate transporter-like MFS transporter
LQTVERRTIRKISWRLLPLIVIIYFVAYIDRTNVSFAALTMNKDLGLSPYVFCRHLLPGLFPFRGP